jgi:hypothetical protein
MSTITTIRTMLERLVFSSAAATYLTGTCGINSLDEIVYLDGVDDVETTIKGVTNPGGTVTTGKGVTSVTSLNNGIPISIRAVAKLKLCAYYLKHMERVHRRPVANSINLVLVLNYSHSRNPSCARTDTWTNPSAQRATQLRSVLARVYYVSRQNLNTTTVP